MDITPLTYTVRLSDDGTITANIERNGQLVEALTFSDLKAARAHMQAEGIQPSGAQQRSNLQAVFAFSEGVFSDLKAALAHMQAERAQPSAVELRRRGVQPYATQVDPVRMEFTRLTEDTVGVTLTEGPFAGSQRTVTVEEARNLGYVPPQIPRDDLWSQGAAETPPAVVVPLSSADTTPRTYRLKISGDGTVTANIERDGQLVEALTFSDWKAALAHMQAEGIQPSATEKRSNLRAVLALGAGGLLVLGLFVGCVSGSSDAGLSDSSDPGMADTLKLIESNFMEGCTEDGSASASGCQEFYDTIVKPPLINECSGLELADRHACIIVVLNRLNPGLS